MNESEPANARNGNEGQDEKHHRAPEILLQVLGGLLVAFLIQGWEPFTSFLQKIKTASGDVGVPKTVAWTAYLAYLVMVFRQVHGLAAR
jgi:hypothetical protein